MLGVFEAKGRTAKAKGEVWLTLEIESQSREK